MKQLNIGIDIDDTITNTFDYLMPYVADFFNMELDYLKEYNISYTTLKDDMKEKELELARTVYDNVVLDAPLKEDAYEYLNKLKNDGHKLYFITARTNEVYKDAKGITTEYLNKHNIPYDEVICTRDKATACKENNIDLFIDDSINHCTKVNKEGIEVLLFNCKSNKHFDGFRKVYNWKEVLEYINKGGLINEKY